MIICKKCGMHNADTDDFCGQCGAFLEWEGERIEPEAAPVAAAPAPVEQEEAKTGLIGRVKAAIGGDVKTEQAPAGQSTIESPPAAAAAPIAPPPVPPHPAPSAGPPVAPSPPGPTDERSATGTAPVEGSPAAAGPPAVAPPNGESAVASTAASPGPTADPAAESPAAAAGDGQRAEAAPAAANGAERQTAEGETAEAAAAAERQTAEAAAAAERQAAERQAAEAAAAAERQAAERQAAEAATAAAAERQAAEAAANEDKARRAAGLMAKPAVTEPVRATRPAPTAASAGAGAGAAPVAQQPQAVKPAKPVNRPTSRRPTERVRTVNPGDLICGQCGEGNDPKRNFCRNCGASLKEATVVSIPWWRRIFKRKPKAPVPAGTRPGRGRGGGEGAHREMPDVGGLLKKLGLVAVAILAIVALAVPSVRRGVPRNLNGVIKKFIYHYVPVSITKADAFGSELPGHTAANVFQGDVNSFWASPPPKPGTKVRIRLTFNHPQEISLLRITSGDPTNFAGSSRPSVIEYQFSDGKTHPPLQVENLQTPQKFKVSSAKAAYVDIVIDSVYPVAGSPYYSAISRIEAFVKKPGK